MNILLSVRPLRLFVISLLVIFSCAHIVFQASQDPKPKEGRGLVVNPAASPTPNKPSGPQSKQDRGLGTSADNPITITGQQKSGTNKPEIVLQAGITSPQTQLSFSADGRLLASMGFNGNTIKLWDISTGRLLRQLESSIPSMGASSLSRPFRFSTDGRNVIALADGRLRRWDLESGRELNNTPLFSAKDLTSARMSDDGQIVAALNLNSSAVRLWDATSGKELRSIALDEDHERIAAQQAIALSPDGKLLAAFTESVKGSLKGIDSKLQVTMWEVASGRKSKTLPVKTTHTRFGVNDEEVASLAFTADGSWLALRDVDSLKIWDVASGTEVKTFSTPKVLGPQSDPFVFFASKFLFSPNHRIISIVREGREIDLLDAQSNSTLRTLAGHESNVLAMDFSSDSKLVASSGVDNQIMLWDVATGRLLKTMKGAALPISDLAFARDGRFLTLAGTQAVTSWELATGGVRKAIALPESSALQQNAGMPERATTVSPDGKLILTGSSGESVIKVWDVNSGRALPGISLAEGKGLAGAVFSGDSALVALAEKNIPKPKNSSSPSPAQQQGNIPGLPDGMEMPDMTKVMEQLRKDPKKAQEQMKKVQDAMSKGDLGAGISLMESIGMMPGSSTANKSANNLRIVDATSGKQMQSVPLPTGFFNEVATNSMMSGSVMAFSPDGRTLASASGFGAPIVLREVSTGRELRTLKTSYSMSVNAVAWSADGKRVASAHWGAKYNLNDPNAADTFSFEDMTFTIKVWDAQSGNETQTFSGHNNFVNRLAFSRDGRMLASGSYDSTVKVWDFASGKELHTLRGHNGSISALGFSPDGGFLVTGSDDGSAKLWRPQSGELLATLVTLNKGNDWLVVTPDGLFDGSPGGWNQILWRFTPGLFDVSPVEIFFNEYFRPGLLPEILARKKIDLPADISQKDRRQPKLSLELVAGQDGQSVSTRTLQVRIKVAEAPAGAQDVRLFRNGSLVKVWRGDVLHGQSEVTLEAPVGIVAGENHLSAYAFNQDNVKSADATLSLIGTNNLKRPAKLHLLVIGVDHYANSAYDLKYAAADARAFGEEVERQQRRLGRFEQIEMTSLLNQDATKANVLLALKRLAGKAEEKVPGMAADLDKVTAAEPEDSVIVYYAGHGTAQEPRFYLIPHDLGYEGKRTDLDATGLLNILRHSISDLELEQAFERIDAGLMLMVIDACNSGQALETEEKRRGPMNSKGLAQLAYEKGMYILTAAQSYQAALEAEQLGHGYLTYALVEEGLKSAAADIQPQDNQVTVREWLDYATERVPRMQETKMREQRGLDLGIAFVEGEERVADVDKKTLQRPRVFYRREEEAQPLVVARP